LFRRERQSSLPRGVQFEVALVDLVAAELLADASTRQAAVPGAELDAAPVFLEDTLKVCALDAAGEFGSDLRKWPLEIEVEMKRLVVAGDNLRREILGLYQGAAGGDRRLFEDVLKLAHVAWPVVAQEPRERLSRERLHGQVFLCHGVKEVIDEQRNIFQPLAQGGHLNRYDVEPVKEIFAKPAGGHGFGENDI